MNWVRPANTWSSAGAAVRGCAREPQLPSSVDATMRPLRTTAFAAAIRSSCSAGDSNARHAATSSPAHSVARSAGARSARLAISIVSAASRGSRAMRSASIRRSATKFSSALVFASSSAGSPCARRSRSDCSTARSIHTAPTVSIAHSATTISERRARVAMSRVAKRAATGAPGAVASGGEGATSVLIGGAMIRAGSVLLDPEQESTVDRPARSCT
jgi:hypothetical protein